MGQTQGGGWPGGGGGDRFGAPDHAVPPRPNFIIFTEKPLSPVAILCRNGHSAPRQASTGLCLECLRNKKARRRRRKGVPERRPKLSVSGASERRPKATGRAVPERWLKAVFTVYVVSAGSFVKIGLAENMKARLAQMQCSCPLVLTVAFVLPGLTRVDARSIEKAAHDRLSGHHVRGEWFEVASEDAIAAVRYAEIFA